MNRKITLTSYTSTVDAGGGVSALADQIYTVWAKVESRSGSLFTSKEQALWNYDYKITFRYDTTKNITSNFTLDYDGKKLSINSLSIEEEGNRRFIIARCSTTTT